MLAQGESRLFAGYVPANADKCLEKIPTNVFEIQL